jgi:hypothetical protein
VVTAVLMVGFIIYTGAQRRVRAETATTPR